MGFSQEETVEFSRRTVAIGVVVFLFDALLLAGMIAGAVCSRHPLLQAAFAIAAGIVIALLFVVGHDAGHQALTPYRWLNNLIGRLAVLPALHPYSLWILVHNYTHHRWTNLSPKDYVWTPLTMEQYQALPWKQQLLYRVYRSWAGIFIYYFLEFWVKRIMFPSRKEVHGTYKTAYLVDMAFVGVCATAYLVFLVAGAREGWFQSSQPVWNALFFGAILPFAMWNTTMSFVIYLHHTHPDLKWYNDEAEWKRDASQAHSAVHVIFPGPINLFFHWIMEHNAHHARPSIPLYRLREAQEVLKASEQENIVVMRWSPWAHLDIARRCKLYDYQAKRWRDFQGNFTSGSSSPSESSGIPAPHVVQKSPVAVI
jgi:acyl-lipid omega-6 desaturase (Delta-12 desaturase)